MTNDAEIIGFVAELRREIVETGFDVAPAVAEPLIRAALTGQTEAVASVDPHAIVETELLVLWKLLAGLSDADLDTFLHEASRTPGWRPTR